jgi:hypothetical protein
MASRYDPDFDRAVMAGPIVDNAGHLTVIGELEYDGDRCTECETDIDKPGRCFDCDVEGSYVGGLAPRFGAQP